MESSYGWEEINVYQQWLEARRSKKKQIHGRTGHSAKAWMSCISS